MFDYFLRFQGITNDNHKRVYRLWCREKLNLRPSPKRQCIYRDYQALLSPDGINEGWALDYEVSDWVVGPTRKAGTHDYHPGRRELRPVDRSSL